MRLNFWRWLYRMSLSVYYGRFTDWCWHRKMDAFYAKYPIDWIRDSEGKHPVIESLRAW